MESDRKNRGRFYFSKKRIRLFFFCLFICFIITFIFLKYIDLRVKEVLISNVEIEVERISSYVVKKVIKDLDISSDDLINIYRDSEGIIERISYSNKINNIKNKISENVDLEFYNIEMGNYKDYKIYQYNNDKYKYNRRGFLYELSFNSLNKSTLFGNIGPVIPIKLSFIGYSFPDIMINIKEYGINNAMIEVYAVVEVDSVISMPINMSKKKIVVKEVIFSEIISGYVPKSSMILK